MLKTLFFTTILVITTGAFALDIPVGSRHDARIKHVVYKKDEVVRVDAFVGLATQIVFSTEEEIKDYASGFSDGWEFVKRGNIFYLKPKAENADTNLHIVTNKRQYLFELRLNKDWMKKNVKNLPYDPVMTFRIEFIYPGDKKEKLVQEENEREIRARLAARNLPRNWNYTMHVGRDSREIAPAMAYDDGRFTYLKFPNNREIPAIFLVSDDRSESLVNTHVIKDIVVIQRVGKEFAIRLGNGIVGLYNESYDPDGLPPHHGMTSPGLKRVIKGGRNGR
ncbi:MAG: Type IV secretion system protein virB9 precursor [Syntrophorhabdus sp. PtaU1.Bin153]|nr:MAG: Type IV secretion system protein virB9 precursor [Syntrophorhabdus sp. PtaU1.Bin153]